MDDTASGGEKGAVESGEHAGEDVDGDETK